MISPRFQLDEPYYISAHPITWAVWAQVEETVRTPEISHRTSYSGLQGDRMASRSPEPSDKLWGASRGLQRFAGHDATRCGFLGC
jgi:hypothetical protein